MADKAKTLLQRFHLKPSTTLKVSKTAIFVLLGLISVQTVVGGLLWYAGKIQAAGGISQVSTIATLTNFGISTTVDGSGNRYVMQFDGYIRKYNSSGTFQQQWGGRGSAFSEEEYIPGQFYSGEVGYYIAAGPSNTLYATNVDHIEKFTSTGGFTTSWALPDNLWASGITTDSAGYVYVVTGLQGWEGAVTGTPEILKYSPTGVLQTRWGSAGTGNGEFSATGGLALAADSSNNVYVVDGGNYRVQKFNSSGAYQAQWGTQGTNPGQFAGPLAVTVNSANQVYVLDMEGEGVAVEKFSNTGTYLTKADLSSNPPVVSIAAESGNYLVGTNINPNNSVSQLVRIQDTTTLSIDTTSLPNGAVGSSYSQIVATSGQQGSITYSISAGALPAGLNINASTGEISGTATAAGTYSFTIQAADSEASDTQALAITIDAFSRVVTTGSASNLSQTGASLEGTTNLPDSVTQRGFQYGLDSNYGTQTVDSTVNPGFKVASSYTIAASSNLQANYASYGMTVDADGNRFIVDTTNNNILKYSKNGILQSTWGSTGSGNGQFSHPTDIAISPDGKFYIVDDYNDRVQILSQNGGYEGQFALPAGDENTAISIDSTGSVYVTGMNASGPWYLREYRSYVHRYNASGTVLLQDWTVPIGQYGDKWTYRDPSYDLAIDANDDVYVVDSTYHSVHKIDATTTGQPILTIGGNGPGNYGNGTASGQFTIPTEIAVDASNNVYVVDRDRIQKFNSNGEFILSWFYDQSAIYEYRPHSLWVDDDGNVVTASWDWTNQGQPQLITYSSAIQSSISGLTCGTVYHFRAFATDANGTTYGNDATFTTSACPDVPINIATTALQGGTTTVEYQDLVNIDNATGGVTYSVSSGALPDGLSLNSSTGYITGTPTQAGTFNFEVTAADSNSTDTQALSIVVEAYQAPLEITTVALPDIVHSQPCCLPYSENVYSQGSVGDVTYTVIAGTMPPGLSLQALGNTSVSVAGNPTTPGTYTFTVQAQDSRGNGPGGTDTQEYTIVVPDFPSLNIDTTTLPNGTVGAPYNVTVQYSNYVTQPVFSVVSGSLPDGISLTLNGYLEGTPTAPGTYTFTVQAQDIRPGGGGTDTQQLTLVVEPAPAPVVNTPFVTITSPGNNATFTGGNSLVTGTGPANQTITLFVDNQQIGTTTANPQGIWSYQAANITAGSHTLDAKWIPGAEVMFVPVIDFYNLRTVIKAYDTSTDALVKEIVMPTYSYGYGGVAYSSALNGLIVNGFDVAPNQPKVWLIDFTSANITTLDTGSNSFVTDGILSEDGSDFYAATVDGEVHSTNLDTGITTSYDLGVPYNTTGTITLSEDGSKLYAFLTENPPSIALSSFFRPHAGKIYVINTADMSLVRTIEALDNSNSSESQYPLSMQAANGVAYVAAVRRTGVDADYTGESFVKLYDLTTGSFIRQIQVSPLGSSFIAPYGTYIDSSGENLYIHGRNVPSTEDDYLMRVNLINDQSQTIPLTAWQGPLDGLGYQGPPNWGIAVGGGGTKLYTPRHAYVNGELANLMEVYNIESGTLLAGPSYPVALSPNISGYTLLSDNNFIAPITPPKDSIAFSVPNGGTPTCEELGNCPPTCEQQGNCPPTCEQTNTCPKVDCTTTNTCPKPPTCEETNSCPTTTVTPPTTSVTPKIVSTQFPTPAATPSSSRLGWLDRTALAVARFVPQQAAIGFPYVLFVLLLCFALSLYYQSSNEIRKDKLNRDFLAKRTSIRAQQDNFIALASHYLNTPITIIQGGVELEEGKSKK
jgi:DNA-binding beta-propeller fold protein YncE